MAIAIAGLTPFVFPASSEVRPNVVVISIDTLRADHMGAYGYARDTTPRLDAWARGAVRFDQVTAAANSTLPSHMSMFTSLHPDAHGVVDRNDDVKLQLSTRRRTLAQNFHEAGYETAAFVRDCTWMDPEFGFDRGFDTYSVLETDARRTNDESVMPWLRRRDDQPFFLFVHYYDVHSDWKERPYDAPPPFDSKFTSDYRGSYSGCGDGLCATQYLQHLTKTGGKLSRQDLDYIVGLYDNGIAFVDSEAGRLLDTLSQLGLRENTIVVVISDHGEEFREHGCLGHCSLHEETVRVPWIVSWPGHLEPRVVRSPVQSLDLMPTLLQLTGLPANEDIQGVSRASEIFGGEGDSNRAIYSTVAWGSENSIRKGPWKLILDPETGRSELYHLDSDPAEQKNLASDRGSLAGEMAARLEFFRADNRYAAVAAPPRTFGFTTTAQAEKQKSLGYAVD